MELPDTLAPRRVLQAHERAGVVVQRKDAVAACLRANDVACARKAMDDVDEDAAWARPLRFDIAMAARDYAGAAKTIDLTDADDLGPTFSRFTRLAGASPASLLQGQMPVLAVRHAGDLRRAGLAAGLLLVPRHYRGWSGGCQHRVRSRRSRACTCGARRSARCGGAERMPASDPLFFASRSGQGFNEKPALTGDFAAVLLNAVLWARHSACCSFWPRWSVRPAHVLVMLQHL